MRNLRPHNLPPGAAFGLNPNLPMREYLDRSYSPLSRSDLMHMIHGDPWALYQNVIVDIPDGAKSDNSDSLRKGSAVHYMLEGEFEHKMTVLPRLKDKRDLSTINEKMAEECRRMVAALKREPIMREMQGAIIEGTVYFEHDETGLGLRSRPDIWIPGECVIQVKTIAAGTLTNERKLSSHIVEYGYHVGAALEMQATGERDYVFALVESSYPYRTAFMRPDPELLHLARGQIDQAMLDIDECNKLGYWPQSAISDLLNAPEWYVQKHDPYHPSNLERS